MSDPGSEKLSLGVKLIYGAPSFAGAAMAIPVAVHMPKFYTDSVLVPLGWVALAMALARVLDAILDPFVGWMSDHTHSRWGRRRPWIAVAAPLAALAFVALFTPPASLDSTEAAVWFGTALMLFFTLQMIYGLPHGALGPELTLDYHERSSLFSVREGFALIGTIVAAVAPSLLHEVFADPRREFALLQLLLENAGRVVSREAAQQRLYGWNEDRDSNALDVHVHHLRRKTYPGLIRTVRGVGFLVEAPP